jgi:hypothetical protein
LFIFEKTFSTVPPSLLTIAEVALFFQIQVDRQFEQSRSLIVSKRSHVNKIELEIWQVSSFAGKRWQRSKFYEVLTKKHVSEGAHPVSRISILLHREIFLLAEFPLDSSTVH